VSYDLYLRIDTGGEEPATVCSVGNCTSNVVGMWAEALGYPLADLDGRLADDAIPDLRRAAWNMANNPDTYRAIEPPNGWGNYDGARDYLVSILAGCLEHPKATIGVSR
jgi:hypothetical protein